jgi:hypothetical protein
MLPPMSASDHATSAPELSRGRPAGRGSEALIGGGTDGNEELTAVVGVILIVLLAVLGITILRIRQLIGPHLFLGLLLLGPVALKLASTGYRFARYYTGDPQYRDKGPPELILRALGPIVVLTTVIVFGSGIALLFVGPKNRGAWLPIHKVGFIVWLVFMGVHVLEHLPRLAGSLRATKADGLGHPPGGATGRWIVTAGALVAGLVLAIVLIPHFGTWTAPGAFPHHHHDG